MEELLYDVTTLARIIREHNMSVKETYAFLCNVWEYDKEYLYLEYRFHKKQFLLNVMGEMDYQQNKVDYDKEIEAVNHDLEAIDSAYRYESKDEFDNIRSYFMELRLRIVFIENKDYVRMKLRTLLHDHGYQKRTARLNAYLKQCMYFYHIETFVKGGEACDIEEISLDDMITFRVLQNIRPYITNMPKNKTETKKGKGLPEVKVGNKVITVSLDGIEKHIVLTQAKLELGYARVEFGNKKYVVSLRDGGITKQ